MPGEALGTLINDYLEGVADWELGAVENYRACYSAARSFVLPMNPPRFELDYAVRHFFAAHGVIIKKSHVADWGSRGLSSQPPVHEAAENRATEAAPQRRRRRKRKPVTQKGGSSLEVL